MKKLLVLAVVIAAFAGFYFGGGAEYLKPATYQALNETHPRSTAAIYFVAYVLIAASIVQMTRCWGRFAIKLLAVCSKR